MGSLYHSCTNQIMHSLKKITWNSSQTGMWLNYRITYCKDFSNDRFFIVYFIQQIFLSVSNTRQWAKWRLYVCICECAWICMFAQINNLGPNKVDKTIQSGDKCLVNGKLNAVGVGRREMLLSSGWANMVIC